jgi:hypothetical protein
MNRRLGERDSHTLCCCREGVGCIDPRECPSDVTKSIAGDECECSLHRTRNDRVPYPRRDRATGDTRCLESRSCRRIGVYAPGQRTTTLGVQMSVSQPLRCIAYRVRHDAKEMTSAHTPSDETPRRMLEDQQLACAGFVQRLGWTPSLRHSYLLILNRFVRAVRTTPAASTTFSFR